MSSSSKARHVRMPSVIFSRIQSKPSLSVTMNYWISGNMVLLNTICHSFIPDSTETGKRSLVTLRNECNVALSFHYTPDQTELADSYPKSCPYRLSDTFAPFLRILVSELMKATGLSLTPDPALGTATHQRAGIAPLYERA